MDIKYQTKSAQLAHVTNLISMSRLDGYLTQNEKDYILAVAKEFNLSQAELDKCMKDSDNLVISVPQSEEDKIEYMKDIVSMIFTEGAIDKQKRSFAEHICEKFGYNGKEAVDFIYNELMKEIEESEPDGNDEMIKEDSGRDTLRPIDDLMAKYQTSVFSEEIEDGARCLIENKISEAFDNLIMPALNGGETALRLFLRIPNGVFPMFMLGEKNVKKLKEFSDSGSAIAQYALGRYYQLVRPNRENLRKARELFEAAASQGLGDAFCGLALLARDGHYEEVDLEKYNNLMLKALDNGSRKAIYLAGRDMVYGLNGQEADPQKVINMQTDLLKDATWDAEKDIFNYEPEYFDLLGRAYEETGQKDKAEEAYIEAISLGFFESLSNLINMRINYDESGNIIEKKAFDEYVKVGIEHNDASCFSRRGNVSEEEYNALDLCKKVQMTAAIKADLERASQLGDNVAPWLLGSNYYFGSFGFEENDMEAWKWYNLGASYGSSDCYSMMAQMISEGNCPKKVSEKFHAFCILCAYRYGDESLLEDVIQAYSDGLLDDFKNEIEKYYIPRFNDIAPAEEMPDDSEDANSCLDEITDMEISDPWS